MQVEGHTLAMRRMLLNLARQFRHVMPLPVASRRVELRKVADRFFFLADLSPKVNCFVFIHIWDAASKLQLFGGRYTYAH